MLCFSHDNANTKTTKLTREIIAYNGYINVDPLFLLKKRQTYG